MCPHNEKIAFSTLRGAALAALEVLEKHGSPQRPYGDCPCGSFHLTSKPLNGSGQLTADMVRALARALNI